MLTTCTNTAGSRTCSACPSGYTGTGATACTDIDECQSNNGGCDLLTTCTNTAGSRTCGACPGGYSGDGYSGCVVVSSGAGACDMSAYASQCTNYVGWAYDAATVANNCTATGGTSLTQCPTTNAVGTCTLASAGVEYRLDIVYYSTGPIPFAAATVQASCVAAGGTFTP